MRRSHNDYVTDSNYTNYAINTYLLRLPLQSWVSSDQAGTNKVSLNQYEYDNYNTNPLVSRSNVSGHDSVNYNISNTRRGNVTRLISYSDAQYQTGLVSTYRQYDILGNVVKTIDAKGFINIIDYSDRFGSPNGEARGNWDTVPVPAQLSGLLTFAFATEVTNPAGYRSFSQFDYFSSLKVDSEDLNGNVSTIFYNDILDRPTQIIRVNNRPDLRSQVTTIYDDVNRKVTVTSDLNVFNDNLIKSESFYDSLGRTIDTKNYETGGYVVISKPQYDAFSRVIQSTVPYRPYMNEQPAWTTTNYDSLGRIVKVTTPDNAESTASFEGNITTYIDQAGKKSRTLANAINQIIRVDEPNTNNDLGDVSNPAQATYYTYSTTGNLVKVAQGQQNRYFLYDSLGRLIRVKQPEQTANASLTVTDPVTGNNQWTAGSTYDANGNVLTATDAKGTTITQTYDAINRSLNKNLL